MKRIVKVLAIILGAVILIVAGIAVSIKAFMPNIGKVPDLKIEQTAARYHAPAVAKGEMNTPMPWNIYAGMKPEDLTAIYAYLKSVKPTRNAIVRFEPANGDKL